MFTILKTKDGFCVDPKQPHSTMDIHFFNGGKSAICISCKKEFKNGDKVGFLGDGETMSPAHEVCSRG